MAAGLYDPDAPTAADRLALLEYLVGRGATVAEMVEADADGVLFALSAYLAAFAPVERLPLSDVAARSGTSVDGIRRLLLAEGLPVDEATLLPAYVVDDAAAFRDRGVVVRRGGDLGVHPRDRGVGGPDRGCRHQPLLRRDSA